MPQKSSHGLLTGRQAFCSLVSHPLLSHKTLLSGQAHVGELQETVSISLFAAAVLGH